MERTPSAPSGEPVEAQLRPKSAEQGAPQLAPMDSVSLQLLGAQLGIALRTCLEGHAHAMDSPATPRSRAKISDDALGPDAADRADTPPFAASNTLQLSAKGDAAELQSLRSQLRDCQEQLRIAQFDKSEAEKMTETLVQEGNCLSESLRELEEEKAACARLKKEVSRLQVRVKASEDQSSALGSLVDTLKAKQSELKGSIAKATSKLSELHGKNEENGDQMKRCEKLLAAQQQMLQVQGEHLKKQGKDLRDEKQKNGELQNKLETLNTKLSQETQYVKRLDAVMLQRVDELDSLRQEITHLQQIIAHMQDVSIRDEETIKTLKHALEQARTSSRVAPKYSAKRAKQNCPPASTTTCEDDVTYPSDSDTSMASAGGALNHGRRRNGHDGELSPPTSPATKKPRETGREVAASLLPTKSATQKEGATKSILDELSQQNLFHEDKESASRSSCEETEEPVATPTAITLPGEDRNCRSPQAAVSSDKDHTTLLLEGGTQNKCPQS